MNHRVSFKQFKCLKVKPAIIQSSSRLIVFNASITKNKISRLFFARTKKFIQNSDEMEASTESGVTDVDLLTLSTASNGTMDKESCPMQNQSTQSQVSLELGFSCFSTCFFTLPSFSRYI